MLKNLVNSSDGTAFVRRAMDSPSWLVSRFSSGADQRARDAWAHTDGEPIHWFDVPGVWAQQNKAVSGDPAVGYIDHIASTTLKGRSDLRGVSLGCGTGGKEAEWARTGIFESIVGYDFVERRIEAARKFAHDEQLADVLSFETADVYAVAIAPESIDVVIFDDALHHFTPVRGLLERTREWLKPGALLVIREFVGPRAFQWSTRQIEAANGLLALLPNRIRTDYVTGKVKNKVERPSRLRMRLTDPSEAVESDAILPSVHELFDVAEEYALGGTAVHLAIGNIAHHFKDGEPDAARFLDLMYEGEQALISSGELPSDHMLLLAHRRA